MGIYLLSLSHKTTPLKIRSLFAYSEDGKTQVLKGLLASGQIDEAVVLSTCNRMEIYCHAMDNGKESARPVLEIMEQEAIKAAGAEAVRILVVISAAFTAGRRPIISFGWQQDWIPW